MSNERDELRRGLEGDDFHVLGRDYSLKHQDDVHGTSERLTEGGLVVRGDLTAKFIYPGHTESRVLGRNIVVNSGLDNIARAIAANYSNSTSYQINNFAIGDSKQAEAAGLTELGHIIHSASQVVTFANVGKVTFTLSLLDGAGGYPGVDKVTINEAGLRATGTSPVLVAYKGFSDIIKDASYRLDLSWTLSFTYVAP